MLVGGCKYIEVTSVLVGGRKQIEAMLKLSKKIINPSYVFLIFLHYPSLPLASIYG